MTRFSVAGRVVGAIRCLDGLDPAADRLAAAIRGLVSSDRANDVLSGSWLGHALHPMLVVVPIGSWTSAMVLDLVRGRDSARSSELLIGVGVAAAAPTVVTGLVDWSQSERSRSEVRRIGLLHGATNSTALALYVASLAQRRRGRRAAGVRLARAGFCVLTIGDWLGGHVAFARGVGVNHGAFEQAPREWTRVLDAALLDDQRPVRACVDDLAVVVVRRDGAIYALANRCSHCGGSLVAGRVVGESIQCPLNDTRFRLCDGALERGPGAYPQPAFEVRERFGGVEIRARVAADGKGHSWS